jgi:GAF domain-containing protein
VIAVKRVQLSLRAGIMSEHRYDACAEARDSESDMWRSHEEQLLVEAARLLSGAGALDAILRQTTRLVVPALADYSIIYLRDAGGGFVQAASAHVDPTKAALLENLAERHRPDPSNVHSAIARVAGSLLPLVVEPPTREEAELIFEDAEALRIALELNPVSVVLVPLLAHNEPFGVLVLGTSESGRRYDTHALTYIELIGARIALAIDNARLYRDAQQARDRSLRAADLEGQLAHARLEALQAQLNPHFLFNALNTVAMLVRRGANDDALRGVLSLSELLRKVLAGNRSLEMSLHDELAVVEHYLSIERLRFRDRLTATIVANAEVRDALVPSLMLQPIVENAVRHGIAPGSQTGHVEIRCQRKGDVLVIEVRDNGSGLPDGWDPASARGIGLANTRERLERLYGDAHALEVRSAPESGTVATIELPFRTAKRD